MCFLGLLIKNQPSGISQLTLLVFWVYRRHLDPLTDISALYRVKPEVCLAGLPSAVCDTVTALCVYILLQQASCVVRVTVRRRFRLTLGRPPRHSALRCSSPCSKLYCCCLPMLREPLHKYISPVSERPSI